MSQTCMMPVKGLAVGCVKPSFIAAKMQVWSARTVWVRGSLVDVHRALTPHVHVWVNVADDPSVKLNA